MSFAHISAVSTGVLCTCLVIFSTSLTASAAKFDSTRGSDLIYNSLQHDSDGSSHTTETADASAWTIAFDIDD
jgi:hypothetical protein